MARLKTTTWETAPRLFNLRQQSTPYDYIKMLRKAESQSERFLLNREAEALLHTDEALSRLPTLFPFFTGTLVGYSRRNAAFGSIVSSECLSLLVPEEYQHIRNAALIVEYPNFRVVEEKGAMTVIASDSIRILTRFPKKCGIYKMDDSTGLTVNARTKSKHVQARYLARFEKHGFFGPIVRDTYKARRRGMYLNYMPYTPIGVITIPAKEQASTAYGSLIRQ